MTLGLLSGLIRGVGPCVIGFLLSEEMPGREALSPAALEASLSMRTWPG